MRVVIREINKDVWTAFENDWKSPEGKDNIYYG